jgi:predicted nucleic acid-binding protein
MPLLGSPVLVDASAWVAASDRRDRHHERARSLLEACFARRIWLVTTNWTAYEALSLLKSRAGWDVASDLWALLTDRRSVVLVRITEDFEARAVDLFLSYRDKTWGVVDCASLVVMEDFGCRQALSFDRHFVEASRHRGFELLPGDE